MALINLQGWQEFIMQMFTRLFVSIWKLLSHHGKINVVKDKILYSRFSANKVPELATLSKTFGHECIDKMSKVLKKNGDFDCIINGYYSLYGKTSSCGQKSLTLSQLIEDSKKLGACFYNKVGLRKGDVVHLLLPNCTNYQSFAFGAWMCEAIVSAADPGVSPKVLKSQLEDFEDTIKVIVCYQESRDVTFKVLKELGILGKVKVIVLKKACPEEKDDPPIFAEGFEFYEDFIGNTEDLLEPPSEPKCQDEDVFLILWSSGTTGIPKGIQLKIQLARALLDRYKLKLTLLSTTCMFHVGGFLAYFNLLNVKSASVFNHGPDIDTEDTCEILYQEVDKFKPKMMMFGSHHFILMSKKPPKDKNLDVSSVHFALPMGSTVPTTLFDDLKTSFQNLISVVHIYGMTEVSGVAAISFDPKAGMGSIGPGVALKIVNPETQELCDANEVGEILIKVPILMKGYLNRPEANEEVFGQDGYYHTGDLGSYDQAGRLTFEGRHKDLIKYKNIHLYPNEIENIINAHPDVVDVAVFGRPEPSVQELVTAIVVKKPNSNVTEQEIIDLVTESVTEDAKKLRGGVVFANHLPKNPQGKLLRRKLMETYENVQRNKELSRQSSTGA